MVKGKSGENVVFENKGNEFIEELSVDELKKLLNDSIEKYKAEETLL